MSSSSTPQHEVSKPLAQVYNPAAGGNTPLAALISALSSVAQASSSQPAPIGQGTNDAQFTAQLCSALSLRPDSLLNNFQRSKVQLPAPAPPGIPQGRTKPMQVSRRNRTKAT